MSVGGNTGKRGLMFVPWKYFVEPKCDSLVHECFIGKIWLALISMKMRVYHIETVMCSVVLCSFEKSP